MSQQLFKQKYDELNPEQKAAVDQIEGPLLVVAGPGTGKTQLLSLRVANILQNTDTDARNILCLTFTDAACVNMRKRLTQIISTESYKVAIHTFHNFCTELINQNPEYFFFGAEYKPVNNLTKIEIISTILENLSFDSDLKNKHPSKGWIYMHDIQDRIRDLKQEGITPNQFKEIIELNQEFCNRYYPIIQKHPFDNIRKFKKVNFDEFYSDITSIFHGNYLKNDLEAVFVQEIESIKNSLDLQEKFSTKPITKFKNEWFAKSGDKLGFIFSKKSTKYLELAFVYNEYQLAVHDQGYFDFEDMLLEVVKALEENEDLRYKYQEKYQYILVDEFQDTNGVQSKLIDLLINMEVTEGNPNIMVVGDDDQAIYKFQKASIQNILFFKEKFDDIKIVTLTKNYRSKQYILDFASKIINQNEVRLTDIPEINKDIVSMVG